PGRYAVSRAASRFSQVYLTTPVRPALCAGAKFDRVVFPDFGRDFLSQEALDFRQGAVRPSLLAFDPHWIRRGPNAMDDQVGAERHKQRVPAMQQLLDNPFLLLFIGITIPTVLYIVWGVMEIASIPVAP